MLLLCRRGRPKRGKRRNSGRFGERRFEKFERFEGAEGAKGAEILCTLCTFFLQGQESATIYRFLKQTSMPDDAATFQLPKLPELPIDGKEFFNTLMGAIEPDLTLDHVHNLKEKYAEETEQEHKARMERYKKAFAAYRAKRDEYFAIFTEQVRRFKADLNSFSEDTVRTGEEEYLQELESHFI